MQSCSASNTNQSYQQAIQQLEIQAINFGNRFIKDSIVRASYIEKTSAYAQSLKGSVLAGEISPKEAAQMAHEMRNQIMEWARLESSDMSTRASRESTT